MRVLMVLAEHSNIGAKQPYIDLHTDMLKAVA